MSPDVAVGPRWHLDARVLAHRGIPRAQYECLLRRAHRGRQGQWSPQRDARPWVEFCLTAHYRQPATLLRRIQEAETLWDRCEQAATRHGLPDRVVGAMCDALRGWRLRRSLYVKITESASGDKISDAMATRDLAAMAKAGLLNPVGQKRGRYYEPTQSLRTVWDEIQTSRTVGPIANPYDPER